ncbi:camp-dependent protein kinase regulatory subunit [Ceraceosorus guamensis]|uniref:cAMP-dependent protein kinase regulatory subunit n=1 Tax=Ceraceosorus guamensis TaxID=1522189 RepID=A0A316W8N6_9BASI|nr:camp-dependent protein kinase regulatory subunit [Ceraceosorus guamensis]PWN46280.1 camp-dependent protein kinase regulatory subunit [Ceraceosorus guamensis]
MALPNSYAQILNDLNRDVVRFRPLDPLQFCANWFNQRLENERKATLARGADGTAAAGAVDAASPLASTAGGPDDVTMTSAGGPFSNANPFGASSSAGPAFSLQPPSRDGSIVSLAQTTASSEDDDTLQPFSAPSATYNLGRRTSVSAESLAPLSSAGDEAPAPKTVIPKSSLQLERIRASIKGNLLFNSLDLEQEQDVVNAMKEVRVPAHECIIRQGDQGDYFYIVESGSFEIYIKPTGAASSAGGSDDDSANGGRRAGDTLDLGDKKAVCGPSSYFGELALLYAQPRAASVVSTEPSIVWALDRITFRSIVIGANSRRRALFESHLRKVSLFETLSDAERAKIADALEQREVPAGTRVIEQGERGTEFFIILDGHAEVQKRREQDGVEEAIGKLAEGDYFGELALLNNAPRAASIVASSPALRLATLSESAFKRLVGPLAGIMARHAHDHYGAGASRATRGASPSFRASNPSRGGLNAPPAVPSVGPHESASSGLGEGTWVGGIGASPFGH